MRQPQEQVLVSIMAVRHVHVCEWTVSVGTGTYPIFCRNALISCGFTFCDRVFSSLFEQRMISKTDLSAQVFQQLVTSLCVETYTRGLGLPTSWRQLLQTSLSAFLLLLDGMLGHATLFKESSKTSLGRCSLLACSRKSVFVITGAEELEKAQSSAKTESR